MWASWLLVAYYALGLGLAGLCFVAIHYTTGATWSVAIRRVPEALAGTLPFSLPSSSPMLFIARPQLYPWTTAEASGRREPGAGVQAVLAVAAVLSGSGGDLRRHLDRVRARDPRRSRRQDGDGDPRWTRANVRLSAAFLMVFGVTFTLASFDWVMSLEPHWFSTIFGVYNFAGLFLSGLAAIILVALWLERAGPLRQRAERRAPARSRQAAVRVQRLLDVHLVQPVHADLVHQHPRRNVVFRPAGARRLVPAVSRQHRPQLAGPVRGPAAPRRQAPRQTLGSWRRLCWWAAGSTSI